MSRKPADQLQAGRAFYGRLLPGADVEHFGALWHLFTLGHLVTADLDGAARELGYSFADLDLLGTLAIDEGESMRASDLASSLYISNAVVSVRVRRLVEDGLIERHPISGDRRALALRLTMKGRTLIEQAIPHIAAQAKIVRFFRQLPDGQRDLLVGMLQDLHRRYDREFLGTPYQDD